MPTDDLYKRADDPTEFSGIIRDTQPTIDLRDTPSMEQSRNIARQSARDASRKPTRNSARR